MANTKKYISLDKLGLYDEKIKKVISDGDAATLAAAAKAAEALGVNYDVAGAAATAESNAKGYTDTEVAKANGAAATAQGAAEAAAAAAAAADGKAVAAQGTADGAVEAIGDLADYVGEIPADEAYADIETVIGYVNKKAEETLAAAQGGSSETAASVKAQLDTYKTENNAKVNKNAEDITALQAALGGEAARADAAEKANAAAIKVISDDYLKAADKTELQGNIDTLTGVVETLRDGIDAEKVDGVKDLIAYVEEHGTEVTGMQGNIAQNASDIAGVAGRMDTAEGKIEDLEDAVDAKVEQSAYDEKIAALEGADSGLAGRISTLEGKFGGAEGSVEDMIADAKAGAIADATAAAATDATTKANTAESNAKGYADSLNTAMNIRVEALEAIDHDHANKAELDLIATGDKAKWDEAAGKAHEHGNKTVLDSITAENITTWNTVTSKAAQADLTAATDRITALETWHSNFVEVSEEEINALFGQNA